MSTIDRIDTSYRLRAGYRATGPDIGRARGPLSTVLRTLFRWQENAEQRQQLRELSDDQLKDVGLTREQIQIELDKPFWRI